MQFRFKERQIPSVITIFILITITLFTSCMDYGFEIKKNIEQNLQSSNVDFCPNENNPKILEEQAKSDKENERVCVAKNPNTSKETLEKLITNDSSGKVKVYAVYNDKLAITTLINIMKNSEKVLKDYQGNLKDEDGENIPLLKKYIETSLQQQDKDTIRELFVTIDQDVYQFIQKDMGN